MSRQIDMFSNKYLFLRFVYIIYYVNSKSFTKTSLNALSQVQIPLIWSAKLNQVLKGKGRTWHWFLNSCIVIMKEDITVPAQRNWVSKKVIFWSKKFNTSTAQPTKNLPNKWEKKSCILPLLHFIFWSEKFCFLCPTELSTFIEWSIFPSSLFSSKSIVPPKNCIEYYSLSAMAQRSRSWKKKKKEYEQHWNWPRKFYMDHNISQHGCYKTRQKIEEFTPIYGQRIFMFYFYVRRPLRLISGNPEKKKKKN